MSMVTGDMVDREVADHLEHLSHCSQSLAAILTVMSEALARRAKAYLGEYHECYVK